MKSFYRLSQSAIKLANDITYSLAKLDEIDANIDVSEIPDHYKTLISLYEQYEDAEFCDLDVIDIFEYKSGDILTLYNLDYLILTLEKQ